MAMVCLSNLLEKDKNFYGLLKGIEKEIVEIELMAPKELFYPSGLKYLEETYLGKEVEISTLLEDPKINCPEWCLRSTGHFANHAGVSEIAKPDGSKEWGILWVLRINVMPWLRKQNKKRLLAIADCAFNGWRREKEPHIALTHHPRFKKDAFVRNDRTRLVDQVNEFIKNVEGETEI